ncbi:MAG: hypothetical protein AB7O97_19780 [Planctomycetota bacterium]
MSRNSPLPPWVRVFSFALLSALSTALAAQQVPEAVRSHVPSLRVAAPAPLDLGGAAALALRWSDGTPSHVWAAAEGQRLPVPREDAAAAAWLAAHAKELGHGAFRARPLERGQWRGQPMLTFALAADGIDLHGAEVRVIHDDDGCVAVINLVPSGLPNELPAATPDDRQPDERQGDALRVWWAPADGSAAPALATVRTTRTELHETEELLVAGVVRHTVRRQLAPGSGAGGAGGSARQVSTFTSRQLPGSAFLDQIAADSRGRIWVSDPNGNHVYSLDPSSSQVTTLSVPGIPDGLCVDDRDRVWVGLYGGAALARIDALTGAFTQFPAPYVGARMAIPTRGSEGRIWVTDHLANRISEFDAQAGTFVGATILAVNSYPVGMTTEEETGDLYAPLFSARQLLRLRPGVGVQTTPLAALGPAFCVAHDGTVWITDWNTQFLYEYTIATAQVTAHALQAGEVLGPLAVAPNGHVIVGTRSRGYIVDFDPVSDTWTAHPLPVPAALKDGLCVAPDGSVWFTVPNTAYRLELP